MVCRDRKKREVVYFVTLLYLIHVCYASGRNQYWDNERKVTWTALTLASPVRISNRITPPLRIGRQRPLKKIELCSVHRHS
ncbi:hypothetical protein BDZ94DRAFT_1252529 [Collybia nuda]|uniref:Uncharacterized protein n=1 Tax=Collybia nuda TaxID=64659 RepID=A0A9P5YDX9_9AGAR|nr:hypothetical protein BDZ94DRAFT_1252529 [Collybia nuda]